MALNCMRGDEADGRGGGVVPTEEEVDTGLPKRVTSDGLGSALIEEDDEE